MKVFIDAGGEMTFENKERLSFIMHFLKKGVSKEMIETKNGKFVQKDTELSFSEIWLPCAIEKQEKIDLARFKIKQESLRLSEDVDGYKDPVSLCKSEGVLIAMSIFEKILGESDE